MANLVGQIKGYHGGVKHLANIYDVKQSTIGAANVLMHFDSSPTHDDCGNTWNDYGSQKCLALNGSSYLQTPNIAIGGQDFTVDFWFNVSENNTGGSACFASFWINGNNRIHMDYGPGLYVAIWSANGEVYVGTENGIGNGNWRHYAAVYVHSTATYYLFIDGVLQASQVGRQYTARTTTLYVGMNPVSNRKVTGFIDDFRYSNGVARWTANFTPPARGSISKDANTTVLLKFNTDTTTDECGNTWTAYGSPYLSSSVVTIAQAKFGKALALDGTNYLQISQPITLGGQDFTIDFWGYLSSASTAWGYIFSEASDKFAFNRYDSRNYGHFAFNGKELHNPVSLDTWHHFAWVYEHGKAMGKCYLDGAAGTKYYSGTLAPKAYTFSIGAGYSDGQYKGIGFVDEFRVVNGKAMWTADFTPPTSAYTTTTGASTVNANMMIRHNNADCYIPLTTNAAHTTAPYIAIRHGSTNYFTVK